MLMCIVTASESSSSTATATGALQDAALTFLVAHLSAPTSYCPVLERTASCAASQDFLSISLKMGVLAAVRSAQVMASMERGLNLLDGLGHGIFQPLGHAAEAAEATAAGSDLGELLGCSVLPSTVGKRPTKFAAAVKSSIGELCMITGALLSIARQPCRLLYVSLHHGYCSLHVRLLGYFVVILTGWIYVLLTNKASLLQSL